MTNGEMIQKVFNCEVCEPIPEDDIINVIFPDKNDSAIGFDWSWWNEEYKEPTTKNDLRVDCISRAQTQTEIEMNASRYTISKERGGMGQVEWSDQLIKVSDAVDIIRNLPSVTPKYSSGLEKNSKKLEKNFGELDCISRERVLKFIYDYKENHSNDREHYPINYGTLLDMIRWVRELPSVTPIRPKGHWFVDERPESDREVVCSNCDQPIFKYHKLDFDYRPKYCPNCGSYNGGASNGNE